MSSAAEIRKRIADVARVLCDGGVATENTLRGCTPAQIDEVESEAGVSLPIAYREFLARMGRGGGRFYIGTDIWYPALLGLTQAGRQFVAEDESGIRFPADGIVFLMHQGYVFMFIRAGEGDDPPVYLYLEQSGQFEKKADSFSRFMFDVAHDDW
jgi:hypothetical protein